MFHFIGRQAAAHPWLVAVVWFVAGSLLTLAAPRWDSRAQDDDIHFLPDRCPSVRGHQLMERAFPNDVFASRLVFALEREDATLTEADFALAGRIVDDLEQLRQAEPDLKLGKVCSFRDGVVGSRLTSNDRHCTLIQVALGCPFLALQTQTSVDHATAVVRRRLDEAGGNAPKLYATGSAGIGRDLTAATGESLDATTWATVALVIVVLLLVYRAPLLALIPLVTIALSVWVSLELLALLTLVPGVHLVSISKIFAIVILYGAGTDYCLFLVSRYREELHSGRPIPSALGLSVGAVGAALTASAGTVMCGLGLMGTAEFAKVRCAGPAIALSLGIALLASLTLAPALLAMVGKLAFWPGRMPRSRRPRGRVAHEAAERGFWGWLSRRVAARPLLTWSLAVALLVPLAWQGLKVRPDYRPTGELPPGADSVRGMAAIQRHFAAGETGPLTVLLTSSTDWTSPAGQAELDHLSRGFKHLPGVAEVRSLTQPLGAPLPALLSSGGGRGGFGSMLAQGRQAAVSYYAAQLPGAAPVHVTRLDIVLTTDPFDPQSLATMKLVKIWLEEELPRRSELSDLRSELFGVTVNSNDLAGITESDRMRVNVLILVGIFVILLVLVRRPTFALYLLATVLFSYLATLGATRLAGLLWTGHVLTQVDWRMPFFLFTILVAVGEDYNILLVTRAVEEGKLYGAREGMRRALARTGGTITSCGLIMAGTFGTLMLAGLNTLKQVGFALAFGVLLDTFVVRPVLVPSFALLWWKEDDLPEAELVETDLDRITEQLRRAA
jgi:RND superfamily putative drug exporter